jgi:hypothetical protein
MRPKVLAVLFLLAACGGSRADLHREPAPHPFGLDEPPRPTPESLLSGVGDFPVPVELGCERALEPERPGYAEQPMDTAYDLAVQARFPDTASDDIWAQNYWLTGNEHAFVTLEVLSGDMYNGPARSLVLTTFVNGIQVAPLIDGIETRKLEFVLEPHSSRVIELEFDERLLPAGMFQIAMPIWDRDSPTMGVGTVVYATRERWCFPDRPSALTGEVGEWDPDWGVMLRIYDPRTDTLPPEVALSLGETLELDLLYAGGATAIRTSLATSLRSSMVIRCRSRNGGCLPCCRWNSERLCLRNCGSRQPTSPTTG